MSPEVRERFVQLDFEISNPFLTDKSGFVRKEIWLDRDDDRRVVIMVEWSDRNLWKAITPEQVAVITDEFDQHFNAPYQLIASQEFQVRKR